MPPKNCSICRNAQDHPCSLSGVYSCKHCTWGTLSLARLKLHHFEKHSSHEYAEVFTNRRQHDDGQQEGASVNAEELVSSSEQDDRRQPSGNSSDASVDSGATAASRFAAKEAVSTPRKSRVACPNCSFVCLSGLLLRVHHIATHDGIPFVDPSPPGTGRRLAVNKPERASPQTRPKKNFKMYGYKRDDFVCSDASSTISCDEYSAGPDEASSDATVVSSRTYDSTETSGDDTEVVSSNEEIASCDRCDDKFSTKLDLAAHMRRVHRVRVFCSYCGHGSRKAELLQLHHSRNHRKQPFKYLTLNDGKLVNVTRVDSDDSEETADESTCLIGKLSQVAETLPRQVARKDPAKGPQSRRKGLKKRRQAFSRKSIIISSSSSEEEEEAGSVQVAPSILRNVYFGYRCPKSVGAFQTLMDKSSDKFKCSAFSCGFSTSVSSDFESHLARHKLADVFCMYCGASAASPAALVTHLEQDHSDLQHQCSKCLYRAGPSHLFSVHFVQAHPGETVTFVPIAGERSSAASAPTTDKKVHKPYECGLPGCVFKDRNRHAFERHLEEEHAGSSSFPCFVCDISCRSVVNLVEHLQEHGLADLECCYCSFGAAATSSMMLHACYCHANRPIMFAVRNNNLGEKLITSSNMGTKYIVSCDVTLLVSEQQCCFCPHVVVGFNDLQKHTRTAHGLSLSPEELADRLFGLYNYTEALQLGRCPFCPYVGDKVADLHHHVLRQELQISNFLCSACEHGFEDQLTWQEHIDSGRCPATAMLQLCNNGPLLQWVQQNLSFTIQRFQCTMCAQTFRVVPAFRSHLLRHYTYYPATCKLCDMTFKGIRAREQHLRTSHGAGDDGDTTDKVDAEVAHQTALCPIPVAHACPQCGFRTVSQSYLATHMARCTGLEQLVGYDGRASSDTDEEDKPIYHCMHCSVSFIYLERLLSHGYVQHNCSWFCTACYQGYETEEGCLQHCTGQSCKRPATMFLVERARKKAPGREFFYSEVTVDECAADLSGLSLADQGIKDGFTYYNQDVEPIHRIGYTFVSAGEIGKISLLDFATVVNIQPYVRVRDWKKSF